MRNAALLLVALLPFTAGCGPKLDRNCVEWTEAADACREEAGMEPVFLGAIDCTADPAFEAFNACMVIAWNGADCSSQETVDAVQAGPAYECTQE